MLTAGFLGCGAIGSAISDIHEQFDQNIIRHDLRLNSKLEDLIDADLIFVCLPTPQSLEGACDISIVEQELANLNDLGYEKTIVMKSTVPPGTGASFSNKFDFEYISSPEFLREHNAHSDYLSQKMHIVGTQKEIPSILIKALEPLKSDLKKFQITEAELIKYFHNTFNAWRITFANAFCDLSEELGADYANIVSGFCELNCFSPAYLKSSSEFKGFGGPCLPKDTAALAHLSTALSLPSNVWEFMISENAKRIITLPEGLRESGYDIQ